MIHKLTLLIILASFLVAACGGAAPAPTSTGVQLNSPTLTPAPSSTPAPTATFTPVPLPTLPPTPTFTPTIPPLPPEPQRIEFQAEDGTKLVGLYYPAAVNPAPVRATLPCPVFPPSATVCPGSADVTR